MRILRNSALKLASLVLLAACGYQVVAPDEEEAAANSAGVSNLDGLSSDAGYLSESGRSSGSDGGSSY